MSEIRDQTSEMKRSYSLTSNLYPLLIIRLAKSVALMIKVAALVHFPD
jgi:hypothetical protein